MKLQSFLIAAALTISCGVKAQTMLPYNNPLLSAEERAKDLCSRLTLEEKTKLMMDRSQEIKRLGISRFEWWNEALHGVGRNGTATVFPITMCMASSWNDALLLDVFTSVSDELRAKNTIARKNNTLARYRGNSVWTPNINIFRDPRWGRGQETYGEDPYLTTRMGLAVVRGLQGPEGSKYYKNLACAKHFAIHSGPEWNRHSFNVENIPARDLWETYLPAFKTLVEEGNVREVMCAYQRWDGDPCCGSNKLLRQILRDEWKFDGLVVSDCGAINDFYVPGRHEVSPNAQAASAKAVLAGTDVECGSVYNKLPQAVKEGLITEAQIDESVVKLLAARFSLGDFDDDSLVEWTKIPESVIACQKHKNQALEMARQGIILLQNRNSVLPLSKDAKVAVVGPNADNEMMMWGNYNGFPTETTTIYEGIKALCPSAVLISGAGLCHNEVMESCFPEIFSADGEQGIVGTYWNNSEMKGESVTSARYSNPINLNNGGATVFAPGVELEHFSARYEGVFRPKKSERLTVTCNADDRMRVIIGGDTICDVWKTREKVNLWSGDIKVEKGKEYPVIVEYMQGENYAALQFDIARKVVTTPEDMVRKTAGYDYVVFCGGISPQLEGEEMKVNEEGFKGGDRTSIELPRSQREMVKALAEAGREVIFVNCSGSAVALTPEAARCNAVVQAWYGGEKGGQALGEILFGDVNPSGKLPITFYKDDSQLPDFLDYTMKNRTYRYFSGEPLWAFGHGLSYSTFEISSPRYDKKKGVLTVTVENTGKRDGDEVVQVYLRRPDDAEGPVKTLRAFKRVSLKVSAKSVVEIPFSRQQFEWWDKESNTVRPLSGKYELLIGSSSDDARMKRISFINEE